MLAFRYRIPWRGKPEMLVQRQSSGHAGQREGGAGLERGIWWQKERGRSGRDGVFGVRSSGSKHAVESRNSVARLEVVNTIADFVDGPRDIIALVAFH